MSRAPWQLERAKRRGNKKLRRIAYDMFTPDSTAPQSTPAWVDDAPGLPQRPTKAEGKPGATRHFTCKGLNQMSESKTQALIDPHAYRNTISVAAICFPQAVSAPPGERVNMGYEATGPIEMVRVGGHVGQFAGEKWVGLSDPVTLAATKDQAARVTWGLAGDFEAIVMRTGELFGGTVLYLPGGFHEREIAAVREHFAHCKPGEVLEIAWSCWAFPRPTQFNPDGYSWELKWLGEPRAVDRLKKVRAKLLAGPADPKQYNLGTLHAIEAPKLDPAKLPAPGELSEGVLPAAE